MQERKFVFVADFSGYEFVGKVIARECPVTRAIVYLEELIEKQSSKKGTVHIEVLKKRCYQHTGGSKSGRRFFAHSHF